MKYKIYTLLVLYRVPFTLWEWSIINQLSLLTVPLSAVAPDWVFSQRSLQPQWYGIVQKILDSRIVTAAPMWSLLTKETL